LQFDRYFHYFSLLKLIPELTRRGLESWFELYFEAKKKGKEGVVGTNPKA